MSPVSVTEALAILNPSVKHIHVVRRDSEVSKVVAISVEGDTTLVTLASGEVLTYRRRQPKLLVRDDL